jgi:hypothetical protein
VLAPVRAAGASEPAVAGITFNAAPTSGTQTFVGIMSSRTNAAGPPVVVGSDSATDAGGTSIAVDWGATGPTGLRFSLGNSALGISNVALPLTTAAGCVNLCVRQVILPDGRKLNVDIENGDTPNPVNSTTTGSTNSLNWIEYGFWNIASATNVQQNNAWTVSGYETPNAGLPTTGTATFNGFVQGSVVVPNGTAVSSGFLSGNAQLQANFASGGISGTATGITATQGTASQVWNNLTFAGTFTRGVNGFTGTTAVSNAPGLPLSLSSTAAGYITGRFYGPAAQEVGAIWNVSDGSGAASGYLVGK